MRTDITRRAALQSLGMGLALAHVPDIAGQQGTAQQDTAQQDSIQTVTGGIPGSDLGVTLMHEHIVTDLRAPSQRRAGDYDAEAAFQAALPHLNELREAGCHSFVEITPIHIGRDAVVLRRLSEASGLNIVAATGIYGAADGKFIPDYARDESAEELAKRYIQEVRGGVDATGVRPGIIKTGVNDRAPLPAIEEKLVRAAALAHQATGLTVASHTGSGPAALAQIELLREMSVPLSSFIWVHAQNEQDHEMHYEAARAGAWVEFDGINWPTLGRHVDCVLAMAEANLLNRTLVSHDAGWHQPGEAGGREYRGYTLLFREFLPRLRQSGFSDSDIEQLLVANPRAALT